MIRLFPLLFLILALGFALPAGALTVVPLSEQDLVRQADAIIVGKVLSAHYDRDPVDKHIYTYVQIQVSDYLKAKNRPRKIVLKMLGGIHGEMGMYVDGLPNFYRNEEVMLFLSIRKDGSYHPVGAYQGKYSIRRESQTGRKIVFQSTDGRGEYFFAGGDEEIEGMDFQEKQYLDDFRGKILRYIQR